VSGFSGNAEVLELRGNARLVEGGVYVGDDVALKDDRLSLGSGFSGAPSSAEEGDLSFDEYYQVARIHTDRGSIPLGRNVEFMNGWVTYSAPMVTLGSLPSNSVTTGVIVSVTEGFSAAGDPTGFDGYIGFSGLALGSPSEPEAYGLALDVSESGMKSMTLGDNFGFIPSETDVVAHYSGFSGFSGYTGKVNVTVTYVRSSSQP
jgi:hypothetical protein